MNPIDDRDNQTLFDTRIEVCSLWFLYVAILDLSQHILESTKLDIQFSYCAMSLDIDKKQLLLKLLQRKPELEGEFFRRAKAGESLHVKGVVFPNDVVQEALEEFLDAGGGGAGPSPSHSTGAASSTAPPCPPDLEETPLPERDVPLAAPANPPSDDVGPELGRKGVERESESQKRFTEYLCGADIDLVERGQKEWFVVNTLTNERFVLPIVDLGWVLDLHNDGVHVVELCEYDQRDIDMRQAFPKKKLYLCDDTVRFMVQNVKQNEGGHEYVQQTWLNEAQGAFQLGTLELRSTLDASSNKLDIARFELRRRGGFRVFVSLQSVVDTLGWARAQTNAHYIGNLVARWENRCADATRGHFPKSKPYTKADADECIREGIRVLPFTSTDCAGLLHVLGGWAFGKSAKNGRLVNAHEREGCADLFNRIVKLCNHLANKKITLFADEPYTSPSGYPAGSFSFDVSVDNAGVIDFGPLHAYAGLHRGTAASNWSRRLARRFEGHHDALKEVLEWLFERPANYLCDDLKGQLCHDVGCMLEGVFPNCIRANPVIQDHLPSD